MSTMGYMTSNRTKVELKQCIVSLYDLLFSTSNRTKVELKRVSGGKN